MENLPKVAKAENIVLNYTLRIDTELVQGIIPTGAKIKRVRIIAGYGTSTQFKNASERVLDYGGDIKKWQKKTGITETDNFIYEIHWDEYNCKQYHSKLKGVKSK